MLLLSPLPGLDPMNGDVTYTTSLLANPPPGVSYTTYSEALADGTLSEFTLRATAPHDGLPRLGIAGLNSFINRLRRSGLLFREPTRLLSLRSGSYDLVHCHVFNVHWVERDCPVVLSNANPITWLYSDAFKWPGPRVSLASGAESLVAALLDVEHSSFRLVHSARVIAFTDKLAEWYEIHRVPRPRIDVVPCFTAIPEHPRPRRNPPFVVGFAGDWTAKGGYTALCAFEELAERLPRVRFKVVSDFPPSVAERLARCGATTSKRLGRDTFLSGWLPSIDVLAYPSEFDGLPLTLLEAMALGVPVATSDYGALPAVVGDGGLVSPVGDPATLADNLAELLDAGTNDHVGALGRQRVTQHYSPDVVVKQLRASYDRALSLTSNAPGARSTEPARRVASERYYRKSVPGSRHKARQTGP